MRTNFTFSYRLSAAMSECTVRPNFRSPQRPIVKSESRPFSRRIVIRSVSVCVGWLCPPSPALMIGTVECIAPTIGAPSFGWRMAMMSA